MTMPVHDTKWQMGGRRAATVLLHTLLCGAGVLASSGAALGQQQCLYVLNRLRGTVDAFARPQLSLVASVALDQCPLPQCMPTALAVDTARRRAYVARQDAGTVTVLDMTGVAA